LQSATYYYLIVSGSSKQENAVYSRNVVAGWYWYWWSHRYWTWNSSVSWKLCWVVDWF